MTVAEFQARFIASIVRDGEHVVVGTNLAVARAGVFAAYFARCPNLVVSRGFTFVHEEAPADFPDLGGFFGELEDQNIEALLTLDEQFALARRTDLFFIGGLQVDRHGNSNLAGIPKADGGWKLRGPGPIGTTTFATYARRYVLLINEHSTRSFVEELAVCTSPGHMRHGKSRREIGLPGGGPAYVLSPLGVFDFTPDTCEMRLLHLHPHVTEAVVRERTGFTLHDAVQPLPEPTAEETRILGKILGLAQA